MAKARHAMPPEAAALSLKEIAIAVASATKGVIGKHSRTRRSKAIGGVMRA